MSKQYVVSACLAGESCRYDGGCSPCPAVQALVRTGQALPVCPEVLGGLPTPRVPSEIRGGRVVAKDGTDVPLPVGRRKLCGWRWKTAAQRRSSRPALLPVDLGKSMTAPLPEPACRAKAFSPVWPVRRDSKSGARRRSPKEDSPSCRKSTDGIKTKSGSTRGVAGCETVFSRGMHKKPLQRTAFVPRPAWKAICAGKACEHRFDNVESLWKGRDASRADSFGERDFAEESPLSRCL